MSCGKKQQYAPDGIDVNRNGIGHGNGVGAVWISHTDRRTNRTQCHDIHSIWHGNTCTQTVENTHEYQPVTYENICERKFIEFFF